MTDSKKMPGKSEGDLLVFRKHMERVGAKSCDVCDGKTWELAGTYSIQGLSLVLGASLQSSPSDKALPVYVVYCVACGNVRLLQWHVVNGRLPVKSP